MVSSIVNATSAPSMDEVLDHVAGDEVAAELGLLDGAEGVEDGGLGDQRASGAISLLCDGPGRIPTRGTSISYRAGLRRVRRAASGRGDAARPSRLRSDRALDRAPSACEIRTDIARRIATKSRAIDTPSGRTYRSAAGTRFASCIARARAGSPGAVASVVPAVPRSGSSPVPDVGVRLVQVSKAFGDVFAVDHIDLEVVDGEFFSLLGPSGCGKTTTLRMIGGFEQPTSGLIELQGQDVTWLPPYKRNVNTVFQNYALFPHLTIFENVAFGLRRKASRTPRSSSRVTDMLELVELPGFEQRKPNQISGGQAQRVALARALINRPAVLLLDEPLGALDLKLRKQMQVELKRIQQEVGITFIYVTHDQEEAMTMSDRIAVMNHGRYEQLGDPETLYERPATRFMAGFLGVSNLLPAGSRQGAADGTGRIELVGRRRSSRRRPRAVDGRTTVDVGVRPEKIRLHDDGADDSRPATTSSTASSRDASYLGVSTQYIVETRGGARVTVYEQNIERTTRAELWRAGDQVQHHLDPGPHASSSRRRRPPGGIAVPADE